MLQSSSKNLYTPVAMLPLRLVSLLLCISFAQAQSAGDNPSPATKLTAADVSQLQSKANRGDASAQVTLGRVYEDGNGVAADPESAYKCFRKAADQGNSDGEDYVGTMLRTGEGVATNKVEAVEWYRKAARHGNARAMFNLGTCLFNGDGVGIDDASAYTWFLLAEDAGDKHAPEAVQRMQSDSHADRRAHAFLAVAEIYQAGNDVPRDAQKSAIWYRKAVTLGEPRANVELASLLVKGQGVAQDFLQARSLCEEAARKKYGPGAFCLGIIYRDGLGVSKDATEAAKWFEKGAEIGHPQSMRNIGEMYWKGTGVKIDIQTAYMWMLLAAAANISEAKSEASQIRSEMQSKDVDKATKKAMMWQKTHSILNSGMPVLIVKSP